MLDKRLEHPQILVSMGGPGIDPLQFQGRVGGWTVPKNILKWAKAFKIKLKAWWYFGDQDNVNKSKLVCSQQEVRNCLVEHKWILSFVPPYE